MNYVFDPPRRRPALPVRGIEASFPGAPHLLRRPQLRRARDRDGPRPEQGAAVLLPEEPRQPRRRTAASSPIRPRPRTCITRSSWSWSLSKGGENIPVEKALDHVFGYAVGLDMTRRDLQGEAKKMGRPWESRQGVRASAPSARSCRRPRSAIPTRARSGSKVNGKTRAAGRPQPADLEGAGDRSPISPACSGSRPATSS